MAKDKATRMEQAGRAVPLPERVDALVIGGGPGGLACARRLAAGGARVLLAERHDVFGRKVCAGGLTASMIRRVPPDLLERRFPEQDVASPRQRARVGRPAGEALVATVSRERLGAWMADEARAAGADLRPGVRVVAVTETGVMLRDVAGMTRECRADHVVGADGAHSLVRRSLGLPTRLSLGLNAMLPVRRERMEWHLDPKLFGSGYAWIFPHAECVSVGALVDARRMTARELRQSLFLWAARQGLDMRAAPLKAGFVNSDWRGLRFGKRGTRWLVGDAAGLTSPLTGEGIFPAAASGEAVAEMILAGGTTAALPDELAFLVKRQRHHRRVLALTNASRRGAAALAEVFLGLLRLGLLDAERLAMSLPEDSAACGCGRPSV